VDDYVGELTPGDTGITPNAQVLRARDLYRNETMISLVWALAATLERVDFG
jgi:hypothetical protein